MNVCLFVPQTGLYWVVYGHFFTQSLIWSIVGSAGLTVFGVVVLVVVIVAFVVVVFCVDVRSDSNQYHPPFLSSFAPYVNVIKENAARKNYFVRWTMNQLSQKKFWYINRLVSEEKNYQQQRRGFAAFFFIFFCGKL